MFFKDFAQFMKSGASFVKKPLHFFTNELCH